MIFKYVSWITYIHQTVSALWGAAGGRGGGGRGRGGRRGGGREWGREGGGGRGGEDKSDTVRKLYYVFTQLVFCTFS